MFAINQFQKMQSLYLWKNSEKTLLFLKFPFNFEWPSYIYIYIYIYIYMYMNIYDETERIMMFFAEINL